MDIMQGAEKIVNMCMRVKKGESVVIISDEMRPPVLAKSLFQAAEGAGAMVSCLFFNGKLINGQLPSHLVSEVEKANVVICVTTKTLAYTDAIANCKKNGCRIAALTEADEKTLSQGAIEADFEGLRPMVDYVANAFDSAALVTVTAPGGTNLTFSIEGRKSSTCSGICEPGQLIGLPDVEVYIAPVESQTQGIIAADATCSSIGILGEPIKITVAEGKAVSIEGGEEAAALRGILEGAKSEGSYIVGEFAIGLNPCGGLTGSIITDEGLYGTGHFALGSNIAFGGKNQAPTHLDLVYWHPTIHLDGKLFMEAGELVDFKLNK